MNRYEKYKDSGFDWIGEIPEHWKSIRLKYIGYLYGGLSGKSSKDFNQSANPDNKPFIPFTNIANNKVIDPKQMQYVVIKKGEKQNEVENGDLFFMMSSENYEDVGKSTILLDYLGETYLNSFCKGFRFTEQEYFPTFVNYLLLSQPYRSLLQIEANGFTRINLKIDKVNDLALKVPPFEEQTAIANYLDRKTAEIDELINQKEQLLKLYEEEKTAIINQAVTKGLPCKDARTCVSFKDSGIDWLGEIPEHWEVKKLKYVTKDIITGKTPSSSNSSYYNGDIDWFSPGDFNNNFILNDSNRKITKQAISEARMKIYPPNSVLLVGIGATLGKLGISINASTSNQQINAIIFDEKIVNPFYGLYFLLSIKNAIIRLANAATLAIFNQTQTKEFEIFIPSSEEQTAIVQYIETETTRINTKAKKTKKLIELLKEYKQSLISEVVTGKVKVM
ncbi:MAG: hypothetical protein B6D64_02600 [Bacteroidetes bacterium 4484_276]|nr:MAG: hypothetical protein B6D64_02600 [Bacteroidetes bacterium 4484_276]